MTQKGTPERKLADRERSKAYYRANRETVCAKKRIYDTARRGGSPRPSMKRGRRFGFIHKNTLLATEHPTLLDLAWAAGFFEGEASFSRTSPNRAGGSSERIMVRQMNREPLERLQRLFGGRISIITPKTTTIANYTPRPINSWEVSASLARGLLMTIYPFMSSARSKQIRAALLAA
jgi:hypothetical protein